MDCNIGSYFKPPIVKRYSQSVNINTSWGSLYHDNVNLSITDCGDLTTKDVIVQVVSKYGYSILTSVDNITANGIQLSLTRPTPNNDVANITIFIYDR